MKEFVQKFAILYHEACTLDVAVASAIFGRGMQNHICAKHQGPLEDRAGKGIVHYCDEIVFSCDCCDGF